MPSLKSFISLVVVSPPALLFCLFAPVLLQQGGGPDVHRGSKLEGLLADEVDAGSDIALLQRASGRAKPSALANATAGASENASYTIAPVRFVKNKDILDELPKADPRLPEHLRNVLWLDQRGAYGTTDIPEFVAYDDMCLTLGGPSVKFDPKTRVVDVKTHGTSWQWMNRPESYAFMALATWAEAGYIYQWNEDYSFAQSFLYIVLPILGRITLPKSVLNYRLIVQKPPKGACPPKPTATKEERSKCAVIHRESTFLEFLPTVSAVIGVWDYYIFAVGDPQHKKIQPYFNAYVNFAATTDIPDPKVFGTVWPGASLAKQGGTRQDTSMISTNVLR